MQEGFSRLWRGTNASLALAVPTVSSLKLGCLLLQPIVVHWVFMTYYHVFEYVARLGSTCLVMTIFAI